MVILAGLISIYYNVVVAQCVFYLFASMTSTLPWLSCGNWWNTCYCRTGDENGTFVEYWNETGLNCTDVVVTPNTTKAATEEYYTNYVLRKTSGIGEPGSVNWQMTLCNLLVWFIIAAALIKGIKSMGKVVYFFAIFPYILLTVLLVRGLTLDGASAGVEFYLTPRMGELKKSKVWIDAATQIFFSLSACTGSLTAMASYSKFKNNSMRDSIVIPIINCLTSFYAGFAIFATLGFMAQKKNVPLDQVTDEGTGLTFVVYPEALSRMPVPPLWSILFFLMMTCLGLGTQFPSVETVLTALQDEFPILGKGKWRSVIFRLCSCSLMFLLGLPQTTQGGTYILDLMNNFVAGMPLMLVGLFEIIAIVHVYGFRRLTDDVMMMMGASPFAVKVYHWYFKWNWLVITPVLLLAIIIFSCVQYEPVTGPGYPQWSETLGWLMVTFCVMWIPVWYIGMFMYKGGFKLLRRLNQPLTTWGPLLPENRIGPYAEPFTQLGHNYDEVFTMRSTHGDEEKCNDHGKSEKNSEGLQNYGFQDDVTVRL